MKFDIHVHTMYSRGDSFSNPEDVVKAALEAGLNGIAVTDHNSMEGIAHVARVARKLDPDFIVIPGVEITSSEGHFLGLGVQEEVKPWLTPLETVEKIGEQGGVSVLVHPFRGDMVLIETLKKLVKSLDALEVFNANNYPSENEKAKRVAKQLKLVGVAGSDAHITKSIGLAGITCRGNPLDDIPKGRIEAWGDYNPMRLKLEKYWLNVINFGVRK